MAHNQIKSSGKRFNHYDWRIATTCCAFEAIPKNNSYSYFWFSKIGCRKRKKSTKNMNVWEQCRSGIREPEVPVQDWSVLWLKQFRAVLGPLMCCPAKSWNRALTFFLSKLEFIFFRVEKWFLNWNELFTWFDSKLIRSINSSPCYVKRKSQSMTSLYTARKVTLETSTLFSKYLSSKEAQRK